LLEHVKPAASSYRQTLAAKGADHADTLAARLIFAAKLREQGHVGPAALHFQAVLDARRRTLGAVHSDTLACQIELAVMRVKQMKYPEAETLLLQAREELSKARAAVSGSARSVSLSEVLEGLVHLYDRWDKKDQAAKWRKELRSSKKTDQSGQGKN
jgi:hypothetical protein